MNAKVPNTSTEKLAQTEVEVTSSLKKPYTPPTPKETAEKVRLTPQQRIGTLLKDIKEGAEASAAIEGGEKVPTKAEMVERLAGISGSEFLNYSPEDLRLLFAEETGNGFKVNFHGNDSAFRAIGVGDLLNDETNIYVKRNGIVGKITESSVYGEAKIGYEDADGIYLGIKTGSIVNLTVSEEEIASYEEQFKETGRVYEKPSSERVEKVKLEFKEKFPEIDEGMEEDTSWESVEYNGDIPSDHMNEAVRLLSEEEGFRPDAYPDGTGYAMGYGTHKVERNGHLVNVEKGMTITMEEARNLLPRTIERHISVLRKRIDITKIKPKQFAALASIAYNYGPNFFSQKRGTRVLDALKKGDAAMAAKHIRALTANKARRGREADLLTA